jgi:hypothetical protein
VDTDANGPSAGDVRINDMGDVQVFDGTDWVTVKSTYSDADSAMRDGPGGDASPTDRDGPSSRSTGQRSPVDAGQLGV